MANLAATILEKQGVTASKAIQKVVDEVHNNINLGALGLVIDQTADPMGLITPELRREVDSSWGRDARVIKLVTPEPTIVRARSFTVTHTGQTSSLITVTPGYIGASFRINPNMFRNSDGGPINKVAYAEYVMREMQAITNKIKTTLEAEVVALLQANKTKVLINPLEYQFIGDSLVTSYDQRETILADIATMISDNNYAVDGALGILGDGGVQTLFSRIAENGSNQAVNQSGRIVNKQFYKTNSMSSAVGKYAKGFAVPKGSIGMVTRISPDAMAEDETSDWKFSKFNGAAYGLNFNIEMRSLRHGANVETYTGNPLDTASVEELYHVGFDYAFISMHEADAVSAKTPIIEFLVNTAATDADVTAPTIDSIDSSSLTELTIVFDEAIAIDEDGEVGISAATLAEIVARFTFTETVAGAVITDFVATEDNTELTLTLTASGTPTATTDTINAVAAGFYDGAGNALAAGAVARINAGATAYEAIP